MSEAFPRLFSPTKLAGYTLNNRIAMAPLTRQMAEPDGTPTDEMAAYDARRARGGCGLIITEVTYEEDRLGCRAYLSQPGIANARHVAGWRKVTDAVHKHGAVIILQLMHGGGRVTASRCLAQGPQAEMALTNDPGDIVAIGRRFSCHPIGRTSCVRGPLILASTSTGNTSFDRRWIMGSHIRWRSTIRTGRLAGERTLPMKTEFQRPCGRAETINEGERS
jgi:NADH:flavin oxidoreductase/NADH oxidase family protein